MKVYSVSSLSGIIRTCIIVFAVFCLNVARTCGQTQFQFLLSSDKGLSSTLIGDVLQDKDGNLWVATENGLNKYNGVRLRSYFHDSSDPHSLNSNYIRDLFEDKDGHLYIGTYYGIQIYNPATDSFSLLSTYESGAPFTHLINHIIQRANGDVIISGNVLGKVTVADDGHPVVSDIVAPIPTTAIEEVFEDSQGRLWITKEASGVFRLDPDGSVHKYCTNIGIDPFCLCLCEDKKGNILAGTSQHGMLLFDPKLDDFVPIDNGKYIARALFVNNEEQTLICTDGQGLKCYSNITGTISDYQFDADFVEAPKSKIHYVTKDDLGNLWLGIYQHGALMIPAQKSPFSNYGSHSNYLDIIGRCCVTAVEYGNDGSLYIGTDNDGLYIIGKDRISSRHIAPDDNPNIPPIIIGLHEDSDGYLWMGSYGSGASRMNIKTLQCSKVKDIDESNNEPVSNVYDFAEDNQQRIWIATMGGGLHCYDLKTGQISNCVEINNTVNNWIGCIRYSAKSNSLLLGTYAGLWRIGLDKLDKDNVQILSYAIIYDIYEDSDGIVWAATSDGLARWGNDSKQPDNQDVILIGQKQGLPSNICYSIQGDNFNRLWIGTGNGLVRMHKDSFSQIHFFVEDGIQGNEFSKNASDYDPKTGDLYFGGVNGVSCFNPKEVTSNSHKWEVHISDMYIAGHPITANTMSDGRCIIDKPVYKADKFYLGHMDNAFTLEIGTNDLSNSDKKVIYYAMNNDNWIALPQGIRTVSFGSLPPGTYTFRTKVSDGSIESDVRTIKIFIRPAWWQSWWAITLLVLSIVGILYYVINQYHHRRILRHKMLKHIQSERNSESKLQFLTNVSHEIRTPMTLIMNPLQQLISTDTDESRQHIYKLMQRNANRIMSLVNQLMDVRKIEHGQLRLKMKETELGAYIESVANNFIDVTNSRNISLTLHKIGIDKLSAWIDEDYFDKVLMNLLSNAIKYTPSGGQINIYLSRTDAQSDKLPGFAEIIVSDSGIGIPKEDQPKIFERFFQARNKKSGTGTGVGLHLSRSIVMLHHGTIEVGNNPDNAPGCRFSIRIPLGSSHLSKDEIADTSAQKQDILSSSNINHELAALATEPKTEESKTYNPEDNDKRKTILIAEDDDEIRAYLKDQFGNKYNICTCDNGATALEHIMKKAPHLVISDVMMPEMDGFTLCKKIRQNIQFNDLPIILLTAKTLNEDYIHGLEIGADAYITKPFDIRILKQSVSNLLKSRQALKNIYSGSQSQEGKIDDIETKTPDEKLLEKVMKVINENISNADLSVEMIADAVGMSRVHLHRKLRQLTNQTTRDLIRNQRITLAAKMLKDKNMPISEVAYSVGFTSPAHFTTSFKAMFGMSPSQYAVENAEQNAKQDKTDDSSN